MDSGSVLISNYRAFSNYNRFRHQIMYMNDPKRAGFVLRLLPLLIHLNHPSLPGYHEEDACPRGIKNMERPPDGKLDILSMLPEMISQRSIQECVPRVREIEALFTIGSLGSVGETKDSDCDIWVVVDSGSITHVRMDFLRAKLEAISRWVGSTHNIETYFFLLDVNDIKSNMFGSISHEGAGTSLKSLLKDEFYRTMVLIEGRVPLWWIVPADVREGSYYETTKDLIDAGSCVSPDDFIDLGDITEIPREELLWAALWQMHKALSDPLKSVIKMAQIRMHLEERSNPVPFCNLLKMKIQEAKSGEIIDPYIEAFKFIEGHYLAQADYHTADLMRKCTYIKACPEIESTDLIMFDRFDKKTLICEMIKDWGWSLKTLELFNKFPEWDIQTYKNFGAEIHGFLSSSASTLLRSAGFMASDGDGAGQDAEIEALRRRIESVYVKKEDKVESEKRIMKLEAAYGDLYFNYKNGIWEVYNSPDCSVKTGIITQAPRIASVIAWLVFNRRYSFATSCHMMPNASDVFLSDVQNIMKELLSIIPDARMIGLERELLLERISIDLIILVGNLEQPTASQIKEIDVIAYNSWSELYCMQMGNEELRLWFDSAGFKDSKISIWTPGGADSKGLTLELLSLIKRR